MTEWAYFDYTATTPLDAETLAIFAAHSTQANCNAVHGLGLKARAALEDARAQFAAAIGADSREIVFTSGATEANNLALKGALGYHGVKQPRLITVQSEHKAVLDPAGILVKQGAEGVFLPVQSDGLLDLAVLEAALAAKAPTLVSVTAVNNETGVIQPLRAIADLVHHYGGKLHVDAAQALGKIPLDVRAWDADMVSFSGHKIYAPQGIGALYVRRLPKMRLQAQMHGGGQERGRRSGTSPLALIACLSHAAEQAQREREARCAVVVSHFAQLQTFIPPAMRLLRPLKKAQAVPHIICLYTGLPASHVLRQAETARLALSAGAACQSDSSGSHVLRAMGLEQEATHSIRISLSHLTTPAEMTRLGHFLHALTEHHD